MSAAAVAMLGARVASAAPSPSPSDVVVTGSSAGSPGFLGFVFTFALAVACVGLFLSLTKQLRVVDRRARQREEEGVESPEDRAAEDESGDASAAVDDAGPRPGPVADEAR
ncbi:hypothetical protein [Cellulomonas soli]